MQIRLPDFHGIVGQLFKLQVLNLLLGYFQYFNKGICNLFFKGICDPVQAHFITLEDQSESVNNRRVIMSQ